MIQEEQQFITHKKTNISAQEMAQKSLSFYKFMNTRRSIRHFSDQPVSEKIIENILMSASTSPSGANKQPWHFCAVSKPSLKKEIRIAAEKEEYENYHNRMSEEWLNALEPFGTNWHKPFIEDASWLIIVFRKIYDIKQGQKKNNYYVNESVGIATGFLLTAIHHAGLVALTHTPSPMNFLSKILERPKNEKPFLLIPVGYPKENAQIPNIKRKSKEEIITYYK